MLLEGNIEKRQPHKPVEIMTVELIDESSIRKGIFPEPAGQDRLKHQLNSVARQIVSIVRPSRAEKKLGVLQLRFSQFDQAGLADLSHSSHRDLSLDVRVRIVAFEREVLEAERENVGHGRVDLHHRQGTGWPRQLQPGLLEVVGIEMRVAERMNEI